MRIKALLFVVLVGLSMVMSLSACGKRGAPDPVEGGIYPRDYPME